MVTLAKHEPKHVAPAEPLDRGAVPDLPTLLLNIDRVNGSRFPFVNPATRAIITAPLVWVDDAIDHEFNALVEQAECSGCGCPKNWHAADHYHGARPRNYGQGEELVQCWCREWTA